MVNPDTLLMDSNKSVTVTFTEIPKYSLSVNIVGNGVVTVNGSSPYAAGSVVVMTAYPSEGWTFDGWSGDLTGMVNPDTLLMDSNKSVTVTFTEIPELVYVDIRPSSWPNPINLKTKGVLPVAICGTADFDVTTIDPETIRLTLNGDEVTPLRWSYQDVATPYIGEPCCGHDLNGDGILDLTLKFKTQEVIKTLGLDNFKNRDEIALILNGNLKEEFDGTPIQGQDCIVILKK